LISVSLRRFGDWWFAAEDARARRTGWEIQVVKGGLGRVYRDPRFDCWLLRMGARQ
jgi:hypothetical protein